jgi:hypothetical protein
MPRYAVRELFTTRVCQGIRVGRARVERLMRTHRIVGVHRRHRRGCTVRDPHT